jgi:hypothetical protein
MMMKTQAEAQKQASNILVERAAREALRGQDPALPDLLIDGLPFTPALWNIVVEPLVPRTHSDGGIEVVDLSAEAEGYSITVGRVLRAGPESMKGKTAAGIDLSNFTDEIHTREQLIGKHVIYKHHVGQKLTLRKTGQEVKAMAITDLLGVTEDPHAWKFYI